VAARAAEADRSLAADRIAEAIEATVTSPAVLRDLTAALQPGPQVLFAGAPAVVGRLVRELIARGSQLPLPRCASCGGSHRPLVRSGEVGLCPRCRAKELAEPCGGCGERRPVIARDPEGSPRCWRCCDRPRRRCGICGREGFIARRARGDQPDICNSCFQPPPATCSICGRERPCWFVSVGRPICASCSPRKSVPCAHCGKRRPPTARWSEGPVCEPCYRAARGRRGVCVGCGAERGLVSPPGPDAKLCCDCAGLAPLARCRDCGVEDRPYHDGRCVHCVLAERARALLTGPGEYITAQLTPLYEALVAARQPFSALNWLRSGAGSAILADLAAAKLDISHETLDGHPRRQAADYLRQVLVANGVLHERNEPLARTERWVRQVVKNIGRREDRRMVNAYATWVVLRRLRRRADAGEVIRTRHAKNCTNAAIRLLGWLDARGCRLADLGQGDLDEWLGAKYPSSYDVRDFLNWAARRKFAPTLQVPLLARNQGTVLDDDARWAVVERLLRDDNLDLTDRAAGCLLLLFGQPLSRIVAITVDQIVSRETEIHLRLGRDEIPLPEPLCELVTRLAATGRRYVGIGSPPSTPWLFPGLLPGQPLTAARLGDRLARFGIDARAARRSALIHLAAHLPAPVLAEMLNIAPGTAVQWVKASGGDWSNYAAMIAREHDRGL